MNSASDHGYVTGQQACIDCHQFECVCPCETCGEHPCECCPDCGEAHDGPCDGEDYYDDEDVYGLNRRMRFADPSGNSALLAASEDNPRNLPCPTCRQPDRLTPADRALGYQCDECADRAEGGGY